MKKIHLIILILCWHQWAICQWSNDPLENNIVAHNVLIPLITTDMNDGIIVVSQTHSLYSLIFAKRMSVNGYPHWGGNEGVIITNNPYDQWFTTEGYVPETENVISDGAGGCYICFQIGRFVRWDEAGETEIYDTKLYLQRLDANGSRLFGPEGLTFLPEERDSTGYTQKLNYLCPDGHGGIYVIFWRTAGMYGGSNAKSGVHLARISANGDFVWGPNKLPAYRIDNRFIPYLDSNLNLNLYFYPGETIPKRPDKLIKINVNNGEIISEREIEIGVGEYGFNAFYDYCFSNNFSAIFAFRDYRSDTLRIQKIDCNGKVMWGENPIKIDTDLYRAKKFEIESDNNGGAYVFYRTIDDTFHLAHFDNLGKRIWDRSFYSVKKFYVDIEDMMSVGSDGNVFVLMERIRYLTKFNYNGDLLWETLVSVRDTIASTIRHPKLLADNIGGCIVLWQESSSQFYGMRAQRVDRYGNLAGPTSVSNIALKSFPSQIEIKSIKPNPFHASVTISFSVLTGQQVSLKIYNIIGKEVKTHKSENFSGGDYVINWQGTNNDGLSLSSGIYFLVLQTSVNRVSKKISLIR